MVADSANNGKHPDSWEDGLERPEFSIFQTVKSSLIFGAYTGGAGLVTGSVIGILRSPNPAVFATASGIGTFGVGTGYSAARQVLLHRTNDDPRSKPYVSAMAGSISGAGIAALTRGPRHALPAAVIWGIAGFAGQKGLDIYQRAPKAATDDEARSFWDFKWSPLQKLTDDDYEILLKERLLKIDARLAIIDEDIVKLKADASEQQVKRA